MAVKLTRKDTQQLEDWIGTGPKEFTLLYSATRDGCSNTAFHQKCDNQGPTVTVLYNQQGTVYGGYTGVSWTSISSDYYANSASEFLFRLYYNETLSPLQFPFKLGKTGYGILNSTSYGPSFGAGPDLRTFTGTINNSGGYFALNGAMNIGDTYDVRGLTKNEINNESMNVTELEVYKVSAKRLLTRDREPWRKFCDWNEETLQKLKEQIQDSEVTDAKLVLIGPVGAGKSSFLNSVDSVFTGHITQKASCGNSEQSVSTRYVPYHIKSNDSTLKFCLSDTPGHEENFELDTVEFNNLLQGNMPDYYVLTPYSLLQPESPGFKATPTLNDKVHCVMFVLDATNIDVLSTKFLEELKQIKLLLYKHKIPHMVLLTKVDKLCRDVKQDVTNMYKSEIVEEHVKKTTDLLGVPLLNIHPMKNYVVETECDVDIGIVVLRAVRHALYYANDFLQITNRNGTQILFDFLSKYTYIENCYLFCVHCFFFSFKEMFDLFFTEYISFCSYK